MKKTLLTNFLSSITAAWDELYAIPFPAGPRSLLNLDSDAGGHAAMYPLAGACLGLLGWVMALVMNAITGPVPAAVVFALLAVPGCEVLTRGDGLRIFASFAANLRDGFGFRGAVAELDEETDIADIAGLGLMIGLLAFRFFCFAYLAYRGWGLWLVLVFALSAAAAAHLAERGERSLAYWWMALLPAIALLWLSFSAVALAFLAAVVIAHLYASFCVDGVEALDTPQQSLGRYAIENLLLLLGLICVG